jgi:enoyl-CoA hydratase/carnithine racemase
MKYQRICVTREEAIETITLSNAERRNAIGPHMIDELSQAFGVAQAAVEVRAIVLTGAGTAFCAGGDFTQLAPPLGPTGPGGGQAIRGFADLLASLMRSGKPVIARVNGDALGGGLGLVAASTLAIASSDARLGTPEIHVGLFPMTIAAVLSRLMPRRRLLEMMLLGQTLDAEEAARVGLLNAVVAPQRLDAEVKARADALAGKSPTAVRLGLRAFADQDDLDLERALPMLADRLGQCLASEDAREGLRAFLERRQPRWTGN